MATSEHIKALIKSHYSNEEERFTTLALQIAAHEAKLGHLAMANELRKLIDKSKARPLRLKPFSQDLQGLILEINPTERLSDLIVSKELKTRIEKVLIEYRQKEKLKKHNLTNRRKILLAGPPGTGKTMTAAVIAKELHLPLYTILMDKMVTKFMGETSAKLRQIFDTIAEQRGVYLFDEFDAIGSERGKDNDVGEMRRVLNSFLQFIERDSSESIIISATNNLTSLDQALFRRFDDVLHYHLPTRDEKIKLFENRLGSFVGAFDINPLISNTGTLSHAEISLACMDAIKEAILSNKKKVTKALLVRTIKDRISAYRPSH